jgi:hypothetical protein
VIRRNTDSMIHICINTWNLTFYSVYSFWWFLVHQHILSFQLLYHWWLCAISMNKNWHLLIRNSSHDQIN